MGPILSIWTGENIMSDDPAKITSDETPESTSTAVPNSEPAETQELRATLKADFGLTDAMVDALIRMGVDNQAEMADVVFEDLNEAGVPRITARQILKAYAPVTEAPIVPPSTTPSNDGNPTPSEVSSFATSMGIDPSMLSMLMFSQMGAGAGLDFDLSTMLPIGQIVSGYNPKVRNMPYMIMGQVERRLGGNPIIVINADGSINPEMTQKYIMSLEENFGPAEDNVYWDEAGNPYELIKVGVDAQSIYDADPIAPTQALQKNGMGTGRVMWTGVSLDVRQVVYFAATQTGELSIDDYQWLRDNIKPGMPRLALKTKYPLAISAYNNAARSGALPNLRVQLSKSARRPETMPRRRTTTPKGGTGLTGGTFRPFGEEGDDE